MLAAAARRGQREAGRGRSAIPGACIDRTASTYHGFVSETRSARHGEGGLSWPVLAGFVLLLSLGFLGSRGLWEPDEGRYAAMAWEMAASGDYVTPTLNGVPHFTKPPLTYWEEPRPPLVPSRRGEAGRDRPSGSRSPPRAFSLHGSLRNSGARCGGGGPE
jgi:hypothetical protein